MLTTIRQALRLIGPRWRWRWYVLIPLGVVGAGLEMLGAASVFLLIRLVTDPDATASIEALQPLRSWLGSEDPTSSTVAVAVLLAAVFAFKNALRFGEAYFRQYCAEGAAADLAVRLVEAYLRAPLVFHLRRNSAELIRNVQYAVRSVSTDALHAASIVIAEALITLGLAVALLWVTPTAAIVVVGICVLIGLGLLWAAQGAVIRWGAKMHTASGERLRALQQGLGHVKEIAVFGRVDRFVTEFRRVAWEEVRAFVHYGAFNWVPRLGIETVFVTGLAAMVVMLNLGAGESWRVAPTISVFAYAALRLLPSFHLIVAHLNRLQLAHTAVGEIYRDAALLGAFGPPTKSDAKTEPLSFDERLILDAVSFSYDGQRGDTLCGIELEVARGESLGVVGPTGSGKSTLVGLILGLLEPSSGSIRVDGTDIRRNLRAWQDHIGYVPQDVALLDASLRRNIAFELGDEHTDEERIAEVVRIAQLDELVAAMPEGLGTRIGERGIRLSGGERQRVAVARALYHRPQVLVFDEATSSLDARTEHALTEMIERLRGRQTMIIVAHRLGTVRGCDRLVLLERGRIAATGTYDELFAANETFRALARGAT